MAVLAMAGISTFSGIRIFVALSFTLALAAVVSYFMLDFTKGRDLSVSAEPKSVRFFKHRKATMSLTVSGRGRRWFGVSSAIARSGSTIQVDPVDVSFAGGSFSVTGAFAGKYEGLELEVVLLDVMGLFRIRKRFLFEGFSAEVLPLALLNRPQILTVAGTSTGDISGGGRGSGQEFYGIEDYSPHAEVKDIIWRRLARSTDESLVTRVRESNLPDSVRLGLIGGSAEGTTAWMDMASEAMAQLGVTLLGMGVGVEVGSLTDRGVTRMRARDLEELADLTVGIWGPPDVSETRGEFVSTCDLLVVSSASLADKEVLATVSTIPSLLVQDSGRSPFVREGNAAFSGGEDLSGFISRVLAR